MYSKNGKKSIYLNNRIDIFVIILIFILIISPLFFNVVSRLIAKSRQKDIYISARCEEIFGGKIIETLAREFEKQNPGLRITLLNVPGEKGKEPDILFFDENEFNSLVSDGALLSKESNPAIPLVSFMDLLFYNIELLKSAGFDRPPKTRDEFLNYAETITVVNNGVSAGVAPVFGSLNKISLYRDIFSWVWAAGGNFWQNENSAPVINTRSLINDFNFLARLCRVQELSANNFNMTDEQALENFAKGKIAMIIASTRVIPAIREKMGDDAFGITTIPGLGTAAKYGISLTGIFAGINKNCTYPSSAQIFLDFLAEKSPFLCEQLKAVPGYVPELISGDYKNYIKEDNFYAKAWDIFESSTVVRGFLGETGALEYENAVLEEIRSFFRNDRSAQETVTAIQRRWDKVFEQALSPSP
ncbi:MAG: extracellular solute-binding protein [Treponema sp.]|jgi:multiple sugar transport system substrate-binding protein|nr:extracellular solute-binding protein [Treponema sp.]